MAHGGYPIRLITVGRPKLAPVRELEAHYQGLLKAFARLTVVELPEGRGDTARQLQEEAERIRPQLLASRCPVLLSADGPARSSEAFAQWLGVRMDRGESLAFAVGSSHGFDPALKAEVREHLSLSPMTFPHDVSRVLFLEQLYRAFAILRGTPYHK
jgi:23S rRNA (pseudouridine1915-N3)-methyltransferase